MKNTDLHVHSYYSDGEHSPREIVRIAKKKGIKNLAPADHNSVAGVDEAMKEGKRIGVNIIPAVEVRADITEVLGYFIDYKNKKFRKELQKVSDNVTKAVKQIVKKIEKAGYDISFSKLEKHFAHKKDNWMEIHAIKYLVDRGYGKRQKLWDKLIEGVAHVPIKEISISKAVKIIKLADGVPIIAHPWVEGKQAFEKIMKNMPRYVKEGVKGVEIDNGDRDERRSRYVVSKIKEVVKKYGLIITSGSDFHSLRDKGHKIGNFNCDSKIMEKLKRLK